MSVSQVQTATTLIVNQQTSSPASTRFTWLPKNRIFTTRGFLFLLGALYLVIGPARTDSDIVATVFGYSLLILLLILGIVSCALGRSLKKHLTYSVNAQSLLQDSSSETTNEIISRQNTRIVIRTVPFSIPPGFSLTILIRCIQEGVNPGLHIFSGSSQQPRYSHHDIQFPHRGYWKMNDHICTVSDYFGFTYYTWEIPQSLQFAVHPEISPQQNLPIITSSSRPGDDIPHPQERHGDPFDIKQYHPSDGMSKVLWKIFAKRGELLARHPERSMTPEGESIIFVLANKNDDSICGLSQRYAQSLEELDLAYALGCQGMQTQPIARDAASTKTLFLETAWNSAHADIIKELSRLLSIAHPASAESFLERIALFISEENLCSADGLNTTLKIMDFCEQQSIRPCFFMLSVDNAAPKAPLMKRSVYFRKILSYLLHAEKLLGQLSHPEHTNKFLSICAEKNLEVIITAPW